MSCEVEGDGAARSLRRQLRPSVQNTHTTLGVRLGYDKRGWNVRARAGMLPTEPKNSKRYGHRF
jgi:hypothetical protein